MHRRLRSVEFHLKARWKVLRQVVDLCSASVTCLIAIEHQTILQYRPLETPTTIRIVEILKGCLEDPIEVLLLHVDYREFQYEALSYEWGVASDHDPYILVDSCESRIRRNLYDALIQIRLPDESRYIWIDALSIQQESTTEKSHQVQFMGRIFGGAWNVIVWLGLARDNSDTAMDIVAETTAWTEINGFVMPEWGHSAKFKYTALIALCRRPYWRRVWIQQEVYLA
jgi:hypothetical protein